MRLFQRQVVVSLSHLTEQERREMVEQLRAMGSTVRLPLVPHEEVGVREAAGLLLGAALRWSLRKLRVW